MGLEVINTSSMTDKFDKLIQELLGAPAAPPKPKPKRPVKPDEKPRRPQHPLQPRPGPTPKPKAGDRDVEAFMIKRT